MSEGFTIVVTAHRSGRDRVVRTIAFDAANSFGSRGYEVSYLRGSMCSALKRVRGESLDGMLMRFFDNQTGSNIEALERDNAELKRRVRELDRDGMASENAYLRQCLMTTRSWAINFSAAQHDLADEIGCASFCADVDKMDADIDYDRIGVQVPEHGIPDFTFSFKGEDQ